MKYNKEQSILLGQKFIKEILVVRQIGYDIESKIEGREKEYLLHKWEEGKVFSNEDTVRNLINYYSSSENLSLLQDELEKWMFQIDLDNDRSLVFIPVDNYTPNIGYYFYISATIALYILCINEIIKDKGIDIGILKSCSKLFEKASVYSRNLGIRPPEIKFEKISFSDLDTINKSLDIWYSELMKCAIKEKIPLKHKIKLVGRGLLKGIPYVGYALDEIVFGDGDKSSVNN